ncbi:HAD family hydrolase [Robertkochia sediminum]|uniref:HAD family hydrolase n=1 Tax=Robertkochia sediminum TaxID=2785326 RepID=UPI001931992D|nr:HAD family hydrolase [Robertkochia sediminum]MBL7472731.1 haloacid dehalogenase-like hydrolase [Robertkochia sediminum]
MKTSSFTTALFLFLLLAFWGCKQEQGANDSSASSGELKTDAYATDPLPSWNDGAHKSAIIKFVSDAINEGSTGFIPIQDRIATFDNDGTLWAEQPVYFQLLFVIDRIKEMADDHPEWKEQEPYRSILEGNYKNVEAQGLKAIAQLVMTTHAGTSPQEFRKIVQDWMSYATHPKTGKPFNQMTYQPMLELLEYLRAHDFKTFIVSGGGVEFLRAWAEVTYGIPPYQVVGSSIKTEWITDSNTVHINRLPELEFIDDKEGKPIGINRFIGKVPVFAAGNSDGDLQMLLYSDTKDPSMQLYLHHTDSIREWAYDKESHIGRLDKGLDEAARHGWLVIDMANDWNRVFPD